MSRRSQKALFHFSADKGKTGNLKTRQEPYKHCGEKYDRPGFFYEAVSPFPHSAKYIFESRQLISRQLHYKRSALPPEEPGSAQHYPGEKNRGYTAEISARRYPPRSTEYSAGDQRYQRQLGGTGDERQRHYRYPSFFLVRYRSGSHYARHSAAGRYYIRDKRSPGQTEVTEKLVHYETYSGHISAVLQKSEEEKKYEQYTDYIVEQTKSLLAIDSPSGYTEEAADYVVKTFEELGYKPQKTTKGGVLVCLGGKKTGQGVLLEAHIDTLGGMASVAGFSYACSDRALTASCARP